MDETVNHHDGGVQEDDGLPVSASIGNYCHRLCAADVALRVTTDANRP